VKKTMADSTYIQDLIGFKPSTSLSDGISHTVKWAKNPEISKQLDNWVKSVK
jgi:nucleoside-diphosphate-sugar epimerase